MMGVDPWQLWKRCREKTKGKLIKNYNAYFLQMGKDEQKKQTDRITLREQERRVINKGSC